MDIASIAKVIDTLDEVSMDVVEGGVIVFTYEGVAIVATLTDEEIPRLRFSIDVNELDIEDDGELGELLYKLLDLNTEIDPAAAAIDSTDPAHIMVQVRNTLQVVDLQDDEIVAAVNILISALGEVFTIVKEVA